MNQKKHSEMFEILAQKCSKGCLKKQKILVF